MQYVGKDSKSYQWMAQKKGCPFLDKKSGECRIYSVRPLACRTYYVVSAPEHCSPDKPGAGVQIIDPSEATLTAIEGIAKVVDTIPMLSGSLQSMVLAGMELISNSPAKFQKWLSVHPVDDLSPNDLVQSA
jgi:hypothetical protein